MMKEKSSPAPNTMLHDIHSRLISFPKLFREKVNEECLWSTPTYYRKMRKGEPNPILSNAEREKIIAVLDEKFKELCTYFEKHRKGN